jgi:hypothetical protein
MKKIVIGFLFCFTVIGAHALPAFAKVSINEIMYDVKDLSDTDHEWVELYNDGDTTSLVGWKWNDGSSHTLNTPPVNGGQGTLSIGHNDYIILSGNAATFMQDHPGFSGTVIDTVMSLNNTGATLSVLDQAGTIEDSVKYSSDLGASGDGKTLSKNNGGLFAPADPTPGLVNTFTTNSDIQSTTDSTVPVVSGSSSTTTTVTAKTDQKIGSPFVPIAVKITTLMQKPAKGIPVSFSVRATGTLGEELTQGRFVWSFGDGETNTTSKSTTVSHTYFAPGEYVVYLEYYQYVDQQTPVATDRVIIKVNSADLTIGLTETGLVQIANNGSQEADLFGWKVVQISNQYTFTKHVIVLPRQRIIIPTTVVPADLLHLGLILVDPSGEPTSLPQIIENTETIKKTTDTVDGTKSKKPTASKAKSTPVKKTKTSKSSAPSSEVKAVSYSLETPDSGGSNKSSNTMLIMIALSLLIGVSLFSILYIRGVSKKESPEHEDSFSDYDIDDDE